MTRSIVYTIATCMLLAGLIVSGCVTQKNILGPTISAQPSPAAQDEPISIAPAATITFSEDGKCSLEGPATIPSQSTLKWVVESREYDGYGLIVAAIGPGKTLTDLVASAVIKEPAWATGGYFYQAVSGSQQLITLVSSDASTIYFDCVREFRQKPFGAEGPFAISFGKLGPVTVEKAP